MKRKRCSVEQIVAVVKQAELGLPVAELIRQVGISEQTFYRWKEYAGLEPAQARELKQLAEENLGAAPLATAPEQSQTWPRFSQTSKCQGMD